MASCTIGASTILTDTVGACSGSIPPRCRASDVGPWPRPLSWRTAAVARGGGVCADLGAGTGTFTRALAELLTAGNRIYAVDRDAGAVTALGSVRAPDVSIIPVRADFATVDLATVLDETQLDDVLLANALHFVANAGQVLRRIVSLVRPGGRVVVVEYERRAPSRWVPFPIAADDLRTMVEHAGLAKFA